MSEWAEWLGQLTPDQYAGLSREVQNLQGHSEEDVSIVRADAADKLITDGLVFVDVYDLIPLFNSLAFKKNLLLKGPKGAGKSLAILHYAQATTTPVVIVECGEGTKNRDFIGTFFMRGNKDTPFILGDIPTAIDIANEVGRCMLHFEEINGLTPQMQKKLNGILDFRQSVAIPQIGKSYRLNPGAQLWCTAAMNPSVYGGTYELNEDLRSRWDEIEITYPPMSQEREIVKANIPNMSVLGSKNLDSALKLANETRQESMGYALSSRDVVKFVRNIELVGVKNALQILVCKFENDDRQNVMKRVRSLFSAANPKETWTRYEQ